jgi:hypothetical protein
MSVVDLDDLGLDDDVSVTQPLFGGTVHRMHHGEHVIQYTSHANYMLPPPAPSSPPPRGHRESSADTIAYTGSDDDDDITYRSRLSCHLQMNETRTMSQGGLQMSRYPIPMDCIPAGDGRRALTQTELRHMKLDGVNDEVTVAGIPGHYRGMQHELRRHVWREYFIDPQEHLRDLAPRHRAEGDETESKSRLVFEGSDVAKACHALWMMDHKRVHTSTRPVINVFGFPYEATNMWVVDRNVWNTLVAAYRSVGATVGKFGHVNVPARTPAAADANVRGVLCDYVVKHAAQRLPAVWGRLTWHAKRECLRVTDPCGVTWAALSMVFSAGKV